MGATTGGDRPVKFFGRDWTPEEADRWTRHDLVAAILGAFTFVAFTLGGAWAVFGDPRGWAWLAAAVGASLLLWAVIDRKLRAQSLAFQRREEAHKKAVDERNRWED